MMQPRLKHFGWGREGEGLTADEEAFVLGRIEQRFGPPAEQKAKPPRLEDIKLAPPRLEPPASLSFCSTARYDRAAHTYGKSFPDYVRGLAGDYTGAPDVVAYPRTEDEIAAFEAHYPIGSEPRLCACARAGARHSAAAMWCASGGSIFAITSSPFASRRPAPR